MKKFGYILAILVIVVVAGCSSQLGANNTADNMNATATSQMMMMDTATPEAMMNETATADTMMNYTATPDNMMNETATPDNMMNETATPDNMMGSGTTDTMMASEALLSTSFTDTASGNSFKLSDYSGKVILVELISTKCPACLEQQKSIQAYQGSAGKDVMVVSLDIVPSETTADLQDHLGMTTFKWSYAKAPDELINEIGAQFGSQYIEPANAPLLVIDGMGNVHALSLNLTSEADISNALSSYVSGM